MKLIPGVEGSGLGLLQKNACGVTVLEDLELEINLWYDGVEIPKPFVETEVEKRRSAIAFPVEGKAEAASVLRLTALRELAKAMDWLMENGIKRWENIK